MRRCWASVLQVGQETVPHFVRQRIDERLAVLDRRKAYLSGHPLDIIQAQGADLFSANPVGVEQLEDRIVPPANRFLPINAVQKLLGRLIVNPARNRAELVPAKAGDGGRQLPLHVTALEAERQEHAQTAGHFNRLGAAGFPVLLKQKLLQDVRRKRRQLVGRHIIRTDSVQQGDDISAALLHSARVQVPVVLEPGDVLVQQGLVGQFHRRSAAKHPCGCQVPAKRRNRIAYDLALANPTALRSAISTQPYVHERPDVIPSNPGPIGHPRPSEVVRQYPYVEDLRADSRPGISLIEQLLAEAFQQVVERVAPKLP